MEVLLVLVATLSAAVLAGEEDVFTQKIKAGFEDAKDQAGISDQTNLTVWDVQPVGLDFPCDMFEWTPATNVNKITPYDIAVVGALGDSLTAGQGAKASTILTATTQYRGVSFSAGGDADLSSVTTLPNILKKYNPNLIGYSIGKGNEKSSNSRENCAISGAKSNGILEQAVELVYRMKTNEEINFESDWKLVSIFIGSNDLCDYCNDPSGKYSPETFKENVKKGLDYLYENLPRAIVNLIMPIDVTRLEPVSGLLCNIIHWYACDCISGSTKESTSEASTLYQEQLGELLEDDRYEKEDFAVVSQPFLQGVELPYKDGKPDKSYFAPDCFHFSTKSQAETAKALWNNMLEPVGSKNTGWQIGETIKCPTKEHPYFYTRKNSNDAISLSSDTSSTSHSHQDSSSVVAIVTGSILGFVALAMLLVIAVVIVFVVIVKRRRRDTSEQLPLIRTQI